MFSNSEILVRIINSLQAIRYHNAVETARTFFCCISIFSIGVAVRCLLLWDAVGFQQNPVILDNSVEPTGNVRCLLLGDAVGFQQNLVILDDSVESTRNVRCLSAF